MRERTQKSPVEVTTVVGYDSLLLDKSIREKEQRIADLQQEIEAKKIVLERIIEEIRDAESTRPR